MHLPQLMLLTDCNLALTLPAIVQMMQAKKEFLVQLRDKTANSRELYETALLLQRITNGSIPLLINSRADIAFLAETQGIHLPESSPPPERFRQVFPHLTIGKSVHTLNQALIAEDEGADYLIFGPVFATPSKPGMEQGVDKLREICREVDLPIYAIGGINASTRDACLQAGAYGVAGISQIGGCNV